MNEKTDDYDVYYQEDEYAFPHSEYLLLSRSAIRRKGAEYEVATGRRRGRGGRRSGTHRELV